MSFLKPAKKRKNKALSENALLARVLGGLLCIAFGVMLFLAVVAHLGGEVFLSLRAISYGMAGMLAPALFVLPAWGGILLIVSTQRRAPVRPFVLSSLIFMLALATCNLLTFTGQGSQSLMEWMAGYGGLTSYSQFVGFSYTFCVNHAGLAGGLLGMLIAWPLWTLTGAVVGGILCILGACALFFLMLHLNLARLRERLSAGRAARENRQAADERAWQQENLQWQQQAARAQAMAQPQARVQAPAQYSMPQAAQPEQQLAGFAPQQEVWRPQVQAYPPVSQNTPAYGFPPIQGELNTYWPAPAPAPAEEKPAGRFMSRLNTIFGEADPEEKESGLDFGQLMERFRPIRTAPVPQEEPQEQRPPVKRAAVRTAPEEEAPAAQPAAAEEARPAARTARRAKTAAAVPAEETAAQAAPQPAAQEETPAPTRRRAQRQAAPAAPADDTPPWEETPATAVPKTQRHASGWEPELKIQPVPEGEKTLGQKQNYQPMVEHPYVYPGLELLEEPAPRADMNPEEDAERARKLVDTLASFRVDCQVKNVTHGPAVSRFELELAPGIQVNRVTKLADNIAMNMAAKSVRIEAPIPGKSLVGVEIPNRHVATVTLREVLSSDEMRSARKPLVVALGRDIAGTPVTCDLARMPHLLIAGATGSGKSVCINTIINSLIYRCSPKEVRLILVDPKVVELQCYNGVPHLLLPVVSDPHKASGALAWAVDEMMRRYKMFEEMKVRNLDGYNEAAARAGQETMARIVIIIDELADLMMVCKRDVEERICRLAQLARAAGMHLIVATQRPSVDVITGLIKANIPSRIAFKVTSYVDSRTILDRNGAEQLLGWGDMLYQPTGQFTPTRIQGCFLSDEEVNRVADFIRMNCPAQYDPNIMDELDRLSDGDSPSSASGSGSSPSTDDFAGDEPSGDGSLLAQCIEMAVQDGMISTSTLQRRMRVGYARAGRLVDEMEKRGIVSAKDGAKPRICLISMEQFQQMKASGEIA